MQKEVSVPYVDCRQSDMPIAEPCLVQKGFRHGDRGFLVLHVEHEYTVSNECYDNDVKAGVLYD